MLAERSKSVGLAGRVIQSILGSHITSTEPTEISTIEMRYFSDDLDVEILACHVQSLRHLTAAPALQPFLQVGDASILPLITNKNPITTVYAVAERDIIRRVCRSGMRSIF